MEYIYSMMMGAFLGFLCGHFRKNEINNLIGGVIIAMVSAWLGGFFVLYFGITPEKVIWGGMVTTIVVFYIFFIVQAKGRKKKKQYQLYNEIIKDDLLFLKDKR